MAKAKSTKDDLRFNSWTLGLHGAEVFEKSAEALELERLNPLRGVDEWRLGQIFDDARDGIYADLAWLYNEIEGVEPALLACCDMRESAASECGWLVKTVDAKRVRDFDQSLAEDQRDTLLAAFGAVDDDLAELAGHLTGAFFRGAAHARALWNTDGSLAGFQHLDLWNFALDKKTGLWYWNADASRDERSFQVIPPGELVTLCATRHVDHAALPIFIRAALGAKRYGVWLDRFGIPPVGIIMPATAEKGDQAAYMDLARKFARGGSGILPNASQIVYGTEARSVCPFTDFIRFQQQQIYTVGIGRVQSGETDAANLGGNAAGVVESSFQRIVRRDARRIARAINDAVTSKILARRFPGRPVLAQFAWDTETKRTSREVLEDAGFARNAGLQIDLDQLQELTGYTLSKAPETPVQGPFGGLNSAAPSKTMPQTVENPLQNAPRPADGQGDEKSPDASEGILEAFSKDTSKAAEAVKTLLADPTPEKAEKLLADLPNLLPDDPALAAVIAEAMAAEFRPVPSAQAGGEEKNAGTSEGAKKGWETRRKNGWTPEQVAENKVKIVDLASKALSDRSSDETLVMGSTEGEAAKDIKALTGIDVIGYSQEISTHDIRHEDKRHGPPRKINKKKYGERREDQIPITTEDYGRIPELLSDYDNIELGDPERNTDRPSVVYTKTYPDGILYGVEVVIEDDKKMHYKTGWKKKA